MADYLTNDHAAALKAHGYELVKNEAGHITVADPVLCMSGFHTWKEVRRVTLRTGKEVWRFINERS